MPEPVDFTKLIKQLEGPLAPKPGVVEQGLIKARGAEYQRERQEAATALPGGFGPGDRPLDEIPNYERLTRFERTIMNALPGIANSKAGQFLAGLNEGWFGKVLQAVDIGAEGVERSTGFAAQALAAVGSQEGWQQFQDQLGAAWYAGTFAADFANLPQWRNGKLELPMDLPGLDGMIRARKQIADLSAQGVEMRDAVAQVRQEFMDDAGALALRMQWHDMVFHIAADPLNYVLPILKPIERLKIASLRAITEAAIPQTVADVLPKIDEALDAARAADRLAEVEQLSAFKSVIEAMPTLTPAQEKLLKLTGVIPSEGRWGRFLASKLNPMGLTPASRAREIAINLNDRMLEMLAKIDDPQEMVRLVTAAADGTFDPRVAHMVVTHEGSMVRGLMTGFASGAEELGAGWRAAAGERNLLGFVSQTLGQEPGQVLRRIFEQDEAAAILEELARKTGGSSDELARLAQAVGLDPAAMTAESLIAKLDPLYATGLLSAESFQAQLMIRLMDTTAKALVTKFGVKESGFIVKFAEAIKSAESLMFLRTNPSYLVRNFLNGETTMLSRGVFLWSKTAGDEFLKVLGFTPSRLRSGFGIAEVAGSAAEAGAKAIDNVIGEATRGERGWLNKFRDAFSGVKLGKFDMGARAAAVEAKQSERAFLAGMLRFRRKYYRAAEMGEETRAALSAAVGDDGMRAIERAMGDAFSDEAIDSVLVSDNLNLNTNSVLDNAARRFGTDLDDVIPVEELDGMVGRVADAFRSGGETGARDAAERIRIEVAQKLRLQLEDEMADIAEDVSVRVRVGGPDEALRQHSEAVDLFWGEAHPQYAQEFGVLYDRIKSAPSEVRPALWEGAQARARAFWDDKWGILQQRADGVVAGIRRVEKETGQKFPYLDEYKTVFKDWRKAWDGHWVKRDKLISRWIAGEVDYEEIVGLINASFEETMAREQQIWLHMDELTAQMVSPGARDLYMAGRNKVAEWRDVLRTHTVQFQNDPLGDGRRYIDLAPEEQQAAYRQFWQQRQEISAQVADAGKEARAAMLGDPEAVDDLSRAAADPYQNPHLWLSVEERAARDAENAALASEQGLAPVWNHVPPGKQPSQWATSERGLAMTNVHENFMGGRDGYLRVAYLTEDQLEQGRQAARAADLAKGIEQVEGEAAKHIVNLEELGVKWLPEGARPPSRAADSEFIWNAIPDVDGVLKRPIPSAQGLHELWYSRGSRALDSVVDSVVEQGAKKPLKIQGLDAVGESAVRNYMAQAKAHLSAGRYQAVKFGEWMRDSALLNYQRRLNYNTWLGTLMPYEFWATTSIRNWALHTLDRPFVFSTYLRMQNMLNTGFRPENGLPSRLRGNIRIKMPFLPDWLGDELFVNPLGAALPLSQWQQGIDRLQGQVQGDQARAERALRELLEDKSISQTDYEQALSLRSGPIWERAVSLSRQDDAEGRANVWDLTSFVTSPHAPVLWAYNALSGHPEKIGPFTPIERTIKGLTAILGIGPNGGWSPLGAVRNALGLPEFDQWDDYRIDRMLSNMAADGAITVDEARRAMMDRQGEAFEEAKRRAGIEFGVGAMGSLIGVPAKAYPPGEEHLRKLKDDYEAAWAAYEGGDDQALKRFYLKNPEYEARLGLWDKPEERLRRFTVDNLWEIWNGLPVQHKREVSEQLGGLFQQAFLDRETRSTEDIPLEVMQAWLKVMGGDPPGQVHFSETIFPLDLTDPVIAQQMEAFYQTRTNNFRYNEEVAPLQSDYFQLDKRGRQQFLRDHPVLRQYWDWRRDFMIRNPSLAPYIEDDPEKLPKYPSEQALQEAQEAEPAFTWFEWQNVLGLSTWRLAYDTMALGAPLNKATVDELEAIAASLGMDVDRLLSDMNRAYQESQ